MPVTPGNRRTTASITGLRSGQAHNRIPEHAEVDLDIRRVPDDSVDDIQEFVRAAFDPCTVHVRQVSALLETAEDLAFGLSHVVHLFHPQVIVMGGGLSGVGEPLRAAVADALSRFIMDAFAPGPVLALAALGEDAVPVGALTLARTAK